MTRPSFQLRPQAIWAAAGPLRVSVRVQEAAVATSCLNLRLARLELACRIFASPLAGRITWLLLLPCFFWPSRASPCPGGLRSGAAVLSNFGVGWPLFSALSHRLRSPCFRRFGPSARRRPPCGFIEGKPLRSRDTAIADEGSPFGAVAMLRRDLFFEPTERPRLLVLELIRRY
jgi:hypothetical protein